MRRGAYVDVSNLRTPGAAMGAAGRLLNYLREHRSDLVLALAALIVVAALNVVTPWVTKIVVDDYLPVGAFDLIVWSLLVLFASYVLRAVTNMVMIVLVQRSGQIIVYRLARDLYEHLLRLSVQYFEREASGETLSRLTADVNAVQRATMGPTLGAMTGLLTMFVYAVAMFVMDWRLTLLILVVVPVMVVIGIFSARELRKRYRRVQETLADMNTTLEENLKGIRVSRSFARESDELQRFARDNSSNLRANMDTAIVESVSTSSIQALSSLSVGLIVLYGGWQIMAGSLTAGTLIAFLAFVALFHRPLTEIIQVNYVMQSALAGADRIFQFLDEPTDPTDQVELATMESFAGAVEFQAVSFSYEPGTLVLDNVSFSADRGSVVALVGPTGAGKTTIANLIGRFFDPDSGAVLLDGHDACLYRSSAIRQHMAFVLQETFLFGDTVAGNIRYGRPSATDEEVRSAAQLANAEQFIDALPDGFESIVGLNGLQLSRGQMQRISLARALLANPALLVLDEATSDVDSETEVLIQQAMDAAMSGRTVFVIAHRISTVRHADVILVVDNGRIEEQGTHAELIKHNGLYRRLYGSQFGDISCAGLEH